MTEENKDQGATTEPAAPATAEAAAPATTEAAAPAESNALGLDDMEEGDAVTTEYFKPAEGVVTRCMYKGPAVFKNKQQEELPAVKLHLNDGTFAICASKILVDELSNFDADTPVSVTFLGKGGAEGANQFNKWEVKPLTAKA